MEGHMPKSTVWRLVKTSARNGSERMTTRQLGGVSVSENLWRSTSFFGALVGCAGLTFGREAVRRRSSVVRRRPCAIEGQAGPIVQAAYVG